MTQRTEGAAIRFDAPLSAIGRSTVLRLPEAASKDLPSRGQVAVHGTINDVEFQDLAYEIEDGDVELVDEYRPKDAQHAVVRSVWEGALASARRVEEKLPGELGPWDDFEWGMLNGKWSALGEDRETALDT